MCHQLPCLQDVKGRNGSEDRIGTDCSTCALPAEAILGPEVMMETGNAHSESHLRRLA